MDTSNSSPEKIMTAGIRDRELVLVTFKPALPSISMLTFGHEFYPHSESFKSSDDNDAIRGLLYHFSVFVGHEAPWEKVCLEYFKSQSEENGYSFTQDKLIRLGKAVVGPATRITK